MKHIDQRQHIISRVYLEKFSFPIGDTLKISVLQAGKKFTQHKSINSFNTALNHFDIKSENPEIVKVFENTSGLLETRYPQIIDALSNNKTLTIEYTSYLFQYVANLIVRSEMWRMNLMLILKDHRKANFLKTILRRIEETEEEIENLEIYKRYFNLPPEEAINRVLIFFEEHLCDHLYNFSVTFFEAPADKGWYTSDNPVLIEPLGQNEPISSKTEIYFPMSKNILAYIYFPNSENQNNALRNYELNSIHPLPEEDFEKLTRKIIDNTYKCLICPFEMRYRKED